MLLHGRCEAACVTQLCEYWGNKAQSWQREMAWQSKAKGSRTQSKSLLRSGQKACEAKQVIRTERELGQEKAAADGLKVFLCIWGVHSGRNQGCPHAEILLCAGEHQRRCQMEENVRVPTNL